MFQATTFHRRGARDVEQERQEDLDQGALKKNFNRVGVVMKTFA